MFTIEKYNPEKEAKTLKHSVNVFHEALADGGNYYHVSNSAGDYDISYKMNQEWYDNILPAYIGNIIPDFLSYDENDIDTIDLMTFKDFDQIICMQANEYSIAIVRLALKHTQMSVYFMDPRAGWFLEPCDRLFIGQKPAETKNAMLMVGAIGKGFAKNSIEISQMPPMSDIFVFLSLFWIQDILDGKNIKDIRYMEFPYGMSSIGIGGLLAKTKEAVEFVSSMGWKLVYDGDAIGKFRLADLVKYYKFDFFHTGSIPENTVRFQNAGSINLLRRSFEIDVILDDSVLQDSFRKELEEYEEAVLNGHRTLGVLMRGTDYISSGIGNAIRRQATVEEMVPVIQAWMQVGDYDRIFLATEDKDILNKMRAIFGSKLIAVSQERHSVSEFEQGQLINQLEKQLYSKDEYNERVVENTINYFYALHILSKCQAFLCSGWNNGWDTVCAMNGGKFERVEKMGQSGTDFQQK